MKTIIGFIFIIGAFLFFQHDDFKAEQKANDHAQYVKQLAKQEAQKDRIEYQKLAARAQRMTGIAAK